ncbi:MAG: methyltransferase [Bacteroidota bacterium]
MGASTFRFQQFSIEQDQCAMKVSTDGILLGAWAPPIDSRRVLDIGTGTGLLTLMYAQRNAHLEIDAIEIDPAAAEQARANFEASRFAERLSLYPKALQDYQARHKYDLFLCNPPYFTAGITPPENARAQARHDQSLAFKDLIEHCCRLANKEARLVMILPTEREVAMKAELHKQQWELHRRTLIQASPRKSPHRVLLLAGPMSQVLQEDMLSIYDEQGRYSKAYQFLTQAYYLPFAFE